MVTAGSGAPVTLPFAFTSLVFPSTPLRSVSVNVSCGGSCGGSGSVTTAAAGYPSGHAVDVFVSTVLSGVTIQVTATVNQSRHSFVTVMASH